MSGICGLFNLDDAPVAETELRVMASMLEKRGPEGTNTRLDGPVGLGHTLLATTPELQFEKQPFAHAETDCVISADVRLDNRNKLLESFELNERHDSIGDAELILMAYLKWGEICVDRLLGDFAFAIWDPRHQMLFCARDHFGMRPLCYHHMPGRHFLFASDARAILVLPQVPYRINEGRVADFLVPELEWYDYTSTFFEDVYRLPPGHKAIVTPSGLEVTEYWHPQPGPKLGAMSDDDYRQGFLEVFTNAVEARLRAPTGTVGSMLSGGMDSGSVVAIAKEAHKKRGDGPLPTFSAARRRIDGGFDVDCPESKAIHAASSMPSISPTLIHPDALGDIFEPLTTGFDEPFDGVFVILKAIYLAAHDSGVRVVLDGGGGDIVFNAGTYIERLIRQGNFKLAMAEIVSEHRHWSTTTPVPSLVRHARAAITPEALKKLFRGIRYRRAHQEYVRASLISPDFAQRVGIEDRFERMRRIFPEGWTPDYAVEFCDKIWPNMTAGRERYARIAAATGMEARDPFMDKRVIEYCSRLPGRLRFRNGWPKMILREVMAETLPHEVLWTCRKPHLGWLFYEEITKAAMNRCELSIARLETNLKGYVDPDVLSNAWREFHCGGNSGLIPYAHVLSVWLRQTAQRPIVLV